MTEFSLNQILLTPDHPRKPYQRRTVKKGVYWGQRKLLLTEIHFLTEFYLPIIQSNPRLIYAGGAEGQHFRALQGFFPELDMVLYDPRPFKIDPNDHLEIHQEFFTDRTAEYWLNWSYTHKRPVIFISDIRSADWTRRTGTETEEEVMLDQRAQERWFEIIDPVAAEFKFRLPYSGKGVDLNVNYLSGPVIIQPYPPLASTETRLIPYSSKGRQRKIWNALAYEEQLFYHNSVVREDYHWPDYALNPPELSGTFDNNAEIVILQNYLVKTGQSPQIEDIVQWSNWISQQLGGTMVGHETTRTSE